MNGPSRARAPESGQALRLDPESIDVLARRLAELLARHIAPPEADRPRRLLSASEVSRWWGVGRSWVYAHADQLGALRLGDGPRPRLRFDPDQIALRLGARPTPSPSAPRPSGRRPWSAPEGHGELLPIKGDAELSSPHPRDDRPGDAPTPPGHGAEDSAPGVMSGLSRPPSRALPTTRRN